MTVVEPQAQNICDEFGCGLQVGGGDVRDRREVETTRRYLESTCRELETELGQYSPKREAEAVGMHEAAEVLIDPPPEQYVTSSPRT
jgi:hypothetical protein